MIKDGLHAFSGRRVLLLQGPVGSFFRRLASDLESFGAQVHKVNFNAGDWLFYPSGAMTYQGTFQQWPAWLQVQIERLGIEVIFLFGDCRLIHQAALKVARRLRVEVGVFEEGYVRPNFVTLERFGVNGYSTLARGDEWYELADIEQPVTETPVGPTYRAMAWQALAYGLAFECGRPLFKHYEHHRRMDLREAACWIRSAWRKAWFKWKERGLQDRLQIHASGKYFLVPLQVFNDSQVRVHASFASVEDFIEQVLRSFAEHAQGDTLIVFKHHPMDRGHTDYGRFIRRLASLLGVEGRVLYIHDQHLPTLLAHARGVAVINSTVGLSALHHGLPTLACGNAIYDIPGLTFQGSIDQFWKDAHRARPNKLLYQRFRRYLIANTQLNGSFYRPLSNAGTRSGLAWSFSPTKENRPVFHRPAHAHDTVAVTRMSEEVQGAEQNP